MAARIVDGPKEWSLTLSDEGYRDYTVTMIVNIDDRDGPWTVLTAPGLPRIGDRFFMGNEYDPWAWCRPSPKIKPAISGTKAKTYHVEFTFSNRPLNRTSRDPLGGGNGDWNNSTPQNPLDEPVKVSGSFVKAMKEATIDRFGQAIRTSSFEQVRGAAVEFQESTQTLHFEQNSAVLQIDLISALKDCVNGLEIWGLPPRTCLLSGFSWSKEYHGPGEYFYKRVFDFEINFKTFDRLLNDEGQKVLRGKWNITTGAWELINIGANPPDPNNPQHFIRSVDFNGNPCKVILDGAGKPWTPDAPTCEFIDYGYLVPSGEAEPDVDTSGLDLTAWTGEDITVMPVRRGALRPGQQYRYSVSALSLTGETMASIIGLFTATEDVSGNPKRAVKLSWPSITGAIGYNIYRSMPGIAGVPTYIGLFASPKQGGMPGQIPVEKYDGADFSILNLPVVI